MKTDKRQFHNSRQNRPQSAAKHTDRGCGLASASSSDAIGSSFRVPESSLELIDKNGMLKLRPKSLASRMASLESRLKVIRSGVAVATRKGSDLVPEADYAMSADCDRSDFEVVELSREDALKFLAKEPLVFPDRPKGYILLTYKGLGLGFVKNLGSRSNNLLPISRRIRLKL